MKNIFTQLFKYGLTMLIMVALVFGTNTSYGQQMTTTFPVTGDRLPGESDNFYYEVVGFEPGTTLILSHDGAGTLETTTLASVVTVANSVTVSSGTLTFNWPDDESTYNLTFEAYTGDSYSGVETDINANTLFKAGTNDTDYSLSMNRAGSRFVLSQEYDVDEAERVRLYVDLDEGITIDVDEDHAILVQYSTDNGANFTDLTLSVSNVTGDTPAVGDTDIFDFGQDGDFAFDLPAGAKTASTLFRIIQTNSGTLVSDSRTFEIDDISFTVGNTYATEGVDAMTITSYDVVAPNLEISNIYQGTSTTSGTSIWNGGGIYPGDDIIVEAEVDIDDLEIYNYVVVLKTMSDDAPLTLPVTSFPVGTNSVVISGQVPLDLDYDNWTVKMYAYPLADAEFIVGVNETPDFKMAGTLEDLIDEGAENIGGEEDPGDGLLFDDAGDRGFTFPEVALLTADNGLLKIELARANDLISPTGTGLLIEYTTDGSTFAELETVELNELSATGSTWVEFDGADWPAGVISDNTQFRVTQVSNNGDNLDAWYLVSATISSGSNMIQLLDFVGQVGDYIDILAPAITLDPLDITVGSLAYPLSEFEFTYTITDGEFPANTPGMVLLQRTMMPEPDFDIILGETDDVSGGSIDITVPAIDAGDYTVFLATNGETYESIPLPVYDVDIQVTALSYTDAVTIEGVDHGIPGSEMTVTYTIGGEPGADAELILSIYDDHIDEYVDIAATTDLNGSITGVLPLEVGYATPNLKLSIASGVYTKGFDENVFTFQSVTNNDLDEIFDNTVGRLNTCNSVYTFAEIGERSATSVSYDFSQGASIVLNLRSSTCYGVSDFTVKVQASTDDGTTWVDWDDYDFTTNGQEISKTLTIPNSLWSDNFIWRVIQEEDGTSTTSNTWYIDDLGITSPKFSETSGMPSAYNVIRPSLDLTDYETTDFGFGEPYTIDYNAQNFPLGTEFAALVRQGPNSLVIGTSDQMGASSVDVVMPLVPLGAPNNENYRIRVVPYTPAESGNDLDFGGTWDFDSETDVLEIEGAEIDDDYDFDFELAGDRSMTTIAFDLSAADEATLNFWYDYDGTLDMTTNINVVPRLEVSIDGGATFEAMMVEDVADGEEAMYETGLLYMEGNLSIDIPAEYLTAATHFRWSQPLNMGADLNDWFLNNIYFNTNSGNQMEEYRWSKTTGNFLAGTSITIGAPDLADFDWGQDDQNDAVFNGESFDYSWDVADPEDETVRAWPEGTVFTFTVQETDPSTNENFVIGTTDALGVAEAATSETWDNGNYGVYLTATIDIDGEEHAYETDQWVGSFDLFLRAVELSYLGDENATIYAGNTISFGMDVGNIGSASQTVDGLYSNLILTYGADDWLLAASQSTADITIDLPPFVTGNNKYRVEFSTGAPMGEVGTILESSELAELEDDVDNFISGTVDEDTDVRFETTSGRRFITTRDFEVGELENTLLLEFGLDFDGGHPDDLTDDQYLVFEVSTDGGVTYTEMQKFPEMDADTEVDGEIFRYDVTDDMRNNVTRLRWRQEESKGTVILEDIGFSFSNIIPFDYEEAYEWVNTSSQSLLISSIDSEESCLAGSITINYEIRGRFGADNMVSVGWESQTDPVVTGSIDGQEFNLVEGSGSISLVVPADVLDTDDDNTDFKFRLEANDDTYIDIDQDFEVDGPYSEQNVEVVAPIDVDATFTLASQSECSLEDIMVTIDAVNDNWTYELINLADNSVLGSLTYDAEVGETQINIGMMSQTIEVGMIIKSATSDGTECSSLASSYTDILILNPEYSLYRTRDSGGNWVMSSGHTETICESATNVQIQFGRVASNAASPSYISNANASMIEWFRDDLSTPVTGDVAPNANRKSTFSESGNYFARITDGGCVYITESIAIEVLDDILDIPAVTVVSGDLLACENDINVELSAPAGFTYYQWSSGEGTQNITVDDGGSYRVMVSNVPFDTGCGSPWSEYTVVEEVANPIFRATHSSASLQPAYEIMGGVTVEGCDFARMYFYEGTSNANNGTVIITKDGAEYASTVSTFYDLIESGVYSLAWRNDEINLTCTESIGDFTVTITETPVDAPVLTTTDDLLLCSTDGASVTLTAPEGFAYYQWYRGTSTINTLVEGAPSTSNTIQVSTTNDYTVAVGNAYNCLSPKSNTIEVEVRAEPSINGAGSQWTGSCGDGTVIMRWYLNTGFSYQMMNGLTGLPVGSPQVASVTDYHFFVTDVITEQTPYYLVASYVDGSTCTNSNEDDPRFASPNSVVLEGNGTTIEATISSFNGYEEIRWYRGEVELKNARDNSSIDVIDDATYRIEVDFDGAGLCTVTSNAVTLGGSSGGNVVVPEFVTKLYPNPTRDDVTIEVEGEDFGVYTLQIMSVSGKVLYIDSFDKQSVEFNKTISVGALKAGIYNLQLRNGDHIKNLRFSKF